MAFATGSCPTNGTILQNLKTMAVVNLSICEKNGLFSSYDILRTLLNGLDKTKKREFFLTPQIYAGFPGWS